MHCQRFVATGQNLRYLEIHRTKACILDAAGLVSAVRRYVDGFVKGSNIQVDLKLQEDFGRLSGELETAIFRVVQECLTNIHRPGSPTAKIRIGRTEGMVRWKLRTKARAFPPERLLKLSSDGTPGGGIRGMRARIRQLGGSLEIHSDDKGTVVVARLPIANTATFTERNVAYRRPRSPA